MPVGAARLVFGQLFPVAQTLQLRRVVLLTGWGRSRCRGFIHEVGLLLLGLGSLYGTAHETSSAGPFSAPSLHRGHGQQLIFVARSHHETVRIGPS